MQVVCVLGMHRSGTSVVMRLLNLLGVYLGAEERLLPSAGDNPSGFWEHRGFFEINEEILRHFGGAWHRPPQFPDGWATASSIAPLRERARCLVGEEFAGASVWGWKDPRNCLTLPFWQQVIPRMRYVICVRNPLDVAASLRLRNELSEGECGRLWLEHAVAGFRHTAGKPRLVTFFEDWGRFRQREVARLAAFGGLEVSRQGSQQHREMTAFLRADLVHHRAPLLALCTSKVGFSAKALYLTLRALRRPLTTTSLGA